MDTVRIVYERCNGKSVLSNESDAEHLCISFRHKDPKEPPPTSDDLVLLTTKEAQSLAHATPEKRAKVFEECKTK